ncbi:heme exporter subunit; ATP-binding component of ABC superfamily [Candidatus Methylobacter favarea]|uniref:Heme exporter subunit ATP-binding component of ABC superfamily n=1 Tax=Candidatus Methylobacter favarea TaxID=2707345 RepID=A0A8S0WNX1_9GAMM|nr:cytochrome c biogenesis heme-transporting ATPase CcmA [Candidatus Methylobacter favarea]CAA9890635.1 heme exporter subunit; ATP-binding component of ABC superfamily [Candidatus Methylobacter favarea]
MDRHRHLFLEGTGLSCIRDDRLLFEGLAFKLYAGQILLLEGENGSGKTSLLRIICGFREADSGTIRWCGEALNDSPFYAQMAYVGHLDGIKKELTILENLNISLALSRPGRYSIQEALKKVNLAGFDDVLVQALSAGQKRRLALARLLITENCLWILDEPFTSLDRPGVALIETLMSEHCSNHGMVVLSSHHEIGLPGIDVQRIHLS